ncbi:MAG: hypothetical protein IKG11_02070 [Atopobiaceae bacterium]|nr:hypothetical protein [Atopobiaceae bacterium]
MSMWKKMAACTVAVMTAFSLGACGGSSPASTQQTEEPAKLVEGVDASTLSYTNGDTYSNKFFGFDYVLPIGMKYLDKASLEVVAKQMGLPTDSSNLATGGRALEMYAINDDVTRTAYAIIKNFGAGDKTTVEDFAAQASKEIIDELLDQSVPVTYTLEGASLDIGGKSYPVDVISLTVDGKEYVEMVTYLKKDEYGMTLVFTVPTKDDLNTMASGFSMAAADAKADEKTDEKTTDTSADTTSTDTGSTATNQ